MIKRLLSLLICITITSTFSIANAHGTFTWFGLRKDHKEVVVKSSNHHHNCCHHKHKPKPKAKAKHKPKAKAKPHHHKKGPNCHKWWKH